MAFVSDSNRNTDEQGYKNNANISQFYVKKKIKRFIYLLYCCVCACL